jgi:hypothetical protein
MPQTLSRTRQQAEAAFSKAQSQFLARNCAFERIDTVVQAREEKTLRLREARLAKGSEDREKASVHTAKRIRKP